MVVNDWSGQAKKENIPQFHQIRCWVTIFSTAHIWEDFLLGSQGSPMKTATLWNDVNQSFGHILIQFSSVRLLSRVDSLRPHESQHARPPCPSPTPRVHSNSRPSSQWCHPAISSSVVPFSSCPQSLPASESFPMSQLFEVAKVLEFQL